MLGIRITTTSPAPVEINPGVFIDIDGVVLQGGKPFPFTKQAIHDLWDNQIPFVFVTNGTYCSATLVNNLSNILELPLTDDHVVVAPSPCKALTEFHDKRVLVCCQQDSIGLISELGFKDYTTIPELVKIFPDLNYVDHQKRIELMNTPMTPEMEQAMEQFRPIEAILLLGEPVEWECALQILLDILMTNGDPRNKFKFVPYPHLPLIACNKDLTFKGAAALPRFGHGAFLECLETLYTKVTKNELIYEHLMGKPFLVTYEYAAKQIQKLVPNGKRINKYFIIGDNPEVDIKGANFFKDHLNNLDKPVKLPLVVRRPSTVSRDPSTEFVESILVCTGVYNQQSDMMYHLRTLFLDEENARRKFDSNNNTMSESNSQNELLQMPSRETHRRASDCEKSELKEALFRRNSFISYFDNKCNIPDITVDNLKEAVNHILNKKQSTSQLI